MAVSFNSAIIFHPLDQHFHSPRSGIGSLELKARKFVSPSGFVGLRRSTKEKKIQFGILVADGDSFTTETSQKSSENAERSGSDNLNGSFVSSSTKDVTSSDDMKPGLKRMPLTAREKLRAARVLSRYTETKPSKAQLGSKVLEALRESDKKDRKRSGLPEAPTNLFDDSKRGMPKAGLTWELPVGVDVAIIIFSFVFISILMFATTYFVWKVGAIHFNEF